MTNFVSQATSQGMFAVSKNEFVENHMKLVHNTSTGNLRNHLQFTNVSKIRGMDVIWTFEAI